MTRTMEPATYSYSGDFGDTIAPKSIIPYAQTLVKADPKKVGGTYRDDIYGMALTQANADAVGFVCPDDSWEIVEYPFSESNELIYFSNKPRFAVLRIGETYIKEKESKNPPLPFLDNIELWRSNKENYSIMRRYAIAICDKNGNICHDSPLRIKFHGVQCAQMGRLFGLFDRDVKIDPKDVIQQPAFCDWLKTYRKQQGCKENPKTGFFAQHIFQPYYRPEVRGKGSQSSKIACLFGYHQPASPLEILINPDSRQKLKEFYEISSQWNLGWSNQPQKSEETIDDYVF